MTHRRIVDCHAHIIDPQRFPYDGGPGYKPAARESGTHEAYTAVLDRHGVDHALLVQPSCYGFDNSAMLDAVRNNPGRFKAVAMVDPAWSDDALLRLAASGVVGARFNLVSYDPEAFKRPETIGLLLRMKGLNWFAEVVAEGEQWREVAPVLARSGVNVLIDHFGMHAVPTGIDRPGFQAVLGLGREGRAVVKFSTPFSVSLAPRDHYLLEPFVAALLDAFGMERCIWGSDWPFLAVPYPPDYGEAIGFVARWLADPADQDRLLWQNPVRLFGFGARSDA